MSELGEGQAREHELTCLDSLLPDMNWGTPHIRRECVFIDHVLNKLQFGFAVDWLRL